MTAETAHRHDWPVPPQDGYTVDDLFTLPDLPPHTELIDGSLVFVSPQRTFHSIAIDLLVKGMRSTVPDDLRVRREMTVVVDRRQGPEPDVSVIRAVAATGTDQTHYAAKDVVLAIEVVSPDSEKRDRERKPQIYAQGGIAHFWRVEADKGGQPVVYCYELDPATRVYAVTGIHRERLKLAAPFDIDIDLTELDHL